MSTPQSYNKVDSASPLNAKDSAVKANIQALADLFPAAVQEGVVDFDALTRILGGKTEPQPERFGLNWCGKAAAHAGALVDSAGTLRPCREESKDWDTTKNLYIEGDNLEVLKLLRNSYRGKVKMIYIDPPYNTGKDFVYKDNFHDSIKNYQQITGQQNELKENSETSGRYHTDWLNMMYPRLMLARELLSDDGVIFISIDDHEQAHLKNISSSIFGEENFICNFVWEKGKEGGNDSAILRSHFEYIVCFCKNAKSKDIINLDEKDTSRHVTQLNEPNLVAGIVENSREGEFFQLINLSKQRDYIVTIPLLNGDIITWEGYAPQDTINKWIREGKIFVGAKRVPYVKSYLADELQGQKPSNILTQNFGTTKSGSIEIRNILGNKNIFPYAKPSTLINRLVKITSKKDSICVDFFSGSAATAHAAMQLNAEDGGKRKFIMVQLPEPCAADSEAAKAGYKNICEIGKERIRRAGEKVKAEAGDKAKDLDIGFRVYKLDSSNVNAWDPETNDIEKSLEQAANHLKADRSAEDIMTELMLRFGIMLTNNVEKQECGDTGLEVYNIGCGRHFACLDENLAAHAEEVAHFILEWHKEENPGTHEEEAKDCQVFVVDKAFVGNDAAKKNFCAILSDYGIKQVNAF